MKRIWLVVATLGAHVLMGGSQTPAVKMVAIDRNEMAPPDIGRLVTMRSANCQSGYALIHRYN